MEELKNKEQKPNRSEQIKTVILSLLLFGLLFLLATRGTPLPLILVGVCTVFYLLIKLLDWFLRWGWARIRKQPFKYKHQWLGIGMSLAAYLIIIAIHYYAMHQADQLAIELGTEIQATCDKDKACSIPEKFMAMGKQPRPEILRLSTNTLGLEYPVRLYLVEDNHSFYILVFHFFQSGFRVTGGIGKTLETGDFSE